VLSRSLKAKAVVNVDKRKFLNLQKDKIDKSIKKYKKELKSKYNIQLFRNSNSTREFSC